MILRPLQRVIDNLLVDIGAIATGVKIGLESAFRIGRLRAAATLQRNILKVNKLENKAGRTYYYKDIKDLLICINQKAAKVIEFEHGTAFPSHHAYLSNMFTCTIYKENTTWI